MKSFVERDAAARALSPDTATSSLGEQVGREVVDEDELLAMRRGGSRQTPPLECRLCQRQARSSRHGFPLISIEQNNLSRAPGCRGSLQLVDIYRTVDFEDALRREASKPVRWLPSVCRQFGAGECLGRHAPLSPEGHDR